MTLDSPTVGSQEGGVSYERDAPVRDLSARGWNAAKSTVDFAKSTVAQSQLQEGGGQETPSAFLGRRYWSSGLGM